MGIPFIDLKTQFAEIEPAVRERIDAVLAHGRYIMGPEVGELECKLAGYVGTKYAVSCSSGTDALLLALMAKGIGPGDAVFTSTYTFVATAEVISLVGATPIFVDIDPVTFNIDLEKLELALEAFAKKDPSIHPLPSNVGELTAKGIIPVDLFGLMPDYDRIEALAKKHGVFVLEDAAQSFGAQQGGTRACSRGDVAATSFFPAKPLGCYGDGGMVFTDSEELNDAMISVRVHGKGVDKYDNVRVGLNARMDTLQAGVLLAKFERFPSEVEKRQVVANRYCEALQTKLGGAITPPSIPEGFLSGWAQYTVRLNEFASDRDGIQARMKEAGVPTAVYYGKPLHVQGAYAPLGYAASDFPESMLAADQVLSLPFSPDVQPETITTVVDALAKALEAVPA